ncbi:unnamed protein product, partial [Urochloa humidicola]
VASSLLLSIAGERTRSFLLSFTSQIPSSRPDAQPAVVGGEATRRVRPSSGAWWIQDWRRAQAMREARGMRLGGHEDVARRSSAVERGGPKRWLSAAMQAAAEAPERMVGMALGTAGCAPGAEECSAPILSRYSTVSLHSGSGDGTASLSTSVGATPDLPLVVPSGLPTPS